MIPLADIETDAPTIIKGFQYASQFDFKGFLAAFQSQDNLKKIEDGASAVEVALEIAGLFFLPAAVAANDLKIGEEALVIVGPILAQSFQNLVAVNGGKGGFVSESWEADKREQLNTDGSFKN